MPPPSLRLGKRGRRSHLLRVRSCNKPVPAITRVALEHCIEDGIEERRRRSPGFARPSGSRVSGGRTCGAAGGVGAACGVVSRHGRPVALAPMTTFGGGRGGRVPAACTASRHLLNLCGGVAGQTAGRTRIGSSRRRSPQPGWATVGYVISPTLFTIGKHNGKHLNIEAGWARFRQQCTCGGGGGMHL